MKPHEDVCPCTYESSIPDDHECLCRKPEKHNQCNGSYLDENAQDPVCDKCGAESPDYLGQYEELLCYDCYAVYCAGYDLENGGVKDMSVINHPAYLKRKCELCEEFGINPITETLKSVFGK